MVGWTPPPPSMRSLSGSNAIAPPPSRCRPSGRRPTSLPASPPMNWRREERDGRLKRTKGIGDRTFEVIAQAVDGGIPDYLAGLRERGAEPLVEGGRELLASLRGDLHLHSNWSDGGSPIEAMVDAARNAGPRVRGPDRSFPHLEDRQRAEPRTAQRAAGPHRRDRGGSDQGGPDRSGAGRGPACSPASRSTSWRTGPWTRPPSCWTGWTSWWRACTRSSVRTAGP